MMIYRLNNLRSKLRPSVVDTFDVQRITTGCEFNLVGESQWLDAMLDAIDNARSFSTLHKITFSAI